MNKTKVVLLTKGNDNNATHVENHEANVVTASDSSDSGSVQHDRNELQAFLMLITMIIALLTAKMQILGHLTM